MTTAGDIVALAAKQLRDDTNQTWAQSILLDYLVDGLRVLAERAPHAVPKYDENVALVAGVEQTLPPGAVRLLSVVRVTSGGVTRYPSRFSIGDMARFKPDWASTPPDIPRQWGYDPRNPSRYYLYPPVNAGATAALLYSFAPVSLVATDPVVIVTGFIPVVVNYVCFRALAEDGEAELEASRAQAFYSAFLEAIGGAGS